MNRESERKRLVGLVDNFCQEEWGAVLHNDILEKLADKILADGWMRPPIEVGDVLYATSYGDVVDYEIESILYGANNEINRINCCHYYGDGSGCYRTIFRKQEIEDNTVFTSREEALAKLKGGEDK